MKVHDAPTGFMVIKRSVFEKMMAAYPRVELRLRQRLQPGKQRPALPLLRLHGRSRSKRYLSEDYTFCYLWRQIGGEVYVDVQSNLTHQGAKVYRGSFAESLQTNVANAVYAPEGTTMRLELAAPLHANPRGAE